MKKVFDLAVDPRGWIYVAGDYDGPSVFISKDHGKNWTLIKRFSKEEGGADALHIFAKDPDKIAVSTTKWHGDADGRIYYSEDAGESWTDITGNLPNGTGAAAMAFNEKDSCLYIIRYAGSIFKLKL